MQETHSTVEKQDQWKKEWGAPILFSHGSSNARGVAILIRNGLDITIQLSELGSDGRFIIIKAVIKNELYIIANLSPYLFIIAAELLAVAIRSCSDIKGIKIDSKEFKMVQYADMRLLHLTLGLLNVSLSYLINLRSLLA